MNQLLQESICFLNKKKEWQIRIAIKKKPFTAINKDFHKALDEIRGQFCKWYGKKEQNLREIERAFDKQFLSLATSGVNNLEKKNGKNH